MDDDISFTVPFPPSVNKYLSSTKALSCPRCKVPIPARLFNRRWMTKESKAYKKYVTELIGWTMRHQCFSSPVSIELVYYRPADKRTRDLMNYNKILLDAISDSGLWDDDSLIDQAFLRWEQSKQHPKGAVTVNIKRLDS